MPSLPSTIPWCAVNSSYSEELERNVLSFQPSVGAPKLRRRSSISDSLISFSRSMTRAQWELLKEFYRTDLQDGALSFTAAHPADAGAATFIFTDSPKAQQFGNKRMVQLSVRMSGLLIYDILASSNLFGEPDIFVAPTV